LQVADRYYNQLNAETMQSNQQKGLLFDGFLIVWALKRHLVVSL
jgi:hypothetical protein